MAPVNRRDFLKNSGLATLPLFVTHPVLTMGTGHNQSTTAVQAITLVGDGVDRLTS